MTDWGEHRKADQRVKAGYQIVMEYSLGPCLLREESPWIEWLLWR